MRKFTQKGMPFTMNEFNTYAIADDPIFLDIETANNHAEDPKNLITWISSIQVLHRGQYYLFRTPEELMKFYNNIIETYELREPWNPKNWRYKVLTYIHNSNYDLSYLVPYFEKYITRWNEQPHGIMDGPNRYVLYEVGPFEFRCSYRLASASLEKWSEEMNIEHKKQVGLYDYSKIIYQDTTLSADELKYDQYDVLAMSECLTKQLEHYGDNLTTIPYTSTGYVRRDLRRACKNDKNYRRDYFNKSALSGELYEVCLRSYAGGFTHNNRFYKDKVIRVGNDVNFLGRTVHVSNIGHRDFKSHYPSQMACYNFPTGKPVLTYTNKINNWQMSIKEILDLYPKYTTFSVIRFYSADIRTPDITMPFMQFSKCFETTWKFHTVDNGRILHAAGSWLMFLDNLTLKILDEQYKLSYEVVKVWKILNGPMPAPILNTIDKYFKGKSDKKNEWKECVKKYGEFDERTLQADFELSQVKKLLNGCYGCMATAPLRMSYDFDPAITFHVSTEYNTIDEINEGLQKYYKGRNNFLPYQIGCMITAAARLELYEYIKAIGYDKVLYCDTDSAFYIKDDETETAIEALNAEKRAAARFVTLNNGQREFYDEFTPESDCLAFKGLHAKCYGVVLPEDGLKITVAGVPRRTLVDFKDNKPVYITREDELKENTADDFEALDNLADGFCFKINTGVSALYVGATGYGSPRVPRIIEVDGHKISTAGGCVIRELDSKEVRDIFIPEE